MGIRAIGLCSPRGCLTAAVLIAAALTVSAAGPPICDTGSSGGAVQAPVFVQTFDHGMDVFTIPGSAENCLLWATARGGPLRMGQQNGVWMLDEIFADGFETADVSVWSGTHP